MRNISIYVLWCPVLQTVKYVGQAIDIKQRFVDHKNGSGNKAKTEWVRWLKSKNLLPEIYEIDSVEEEDSKHWEDVWIGVMKDFGFALFNKRTAVTGARPTNLFIARLYDLQKPVYAAAKKKKLSVNDTILYLLDVALKSETK